MDKPLEYISINVRALRNKRKLSQEKLADLAKINLKTLLRVERKWGSPSWTTVQLIAAALEVDPFELARAPISEKKK